MAIPVTGNCFLVHNSEFLTCTIGREIGEHNSSTNAIYPPTWQERIFPSLCTLSWSRTSMTLGWSQVQLFSQKPLRVELKGKESGPCRLPNRKNASADAACPHVARQVQSGVDELLTSQRGLRTLAYSASKGTVASL